MSRTVDQVEQLLRGYIKAFNARDVDALMSIYAADATLEDPVGTSLVRGRAAIRAFYEQFATQSSFLQLTGDFRFAGDAVAFSFFCYLGSNDDPMIIQITDSFRFDEQGSVIEMRAFWGDANIHRLADQELAQTRLPLAGRVILVNGDDLQAAACARALAARGAVVVIAGEVEAITSIACSIRDAGGRAFQLAGMLLDEQPLELPNKAKAMAGRLDGCVNVLPRTRKDAARLTSLRAREQLRAFHDQGMHGAIINVVDAHWHEAMPESLRERARRVARINCIVPDSSSDSASLANVAAWLVSPAAAPVNDQVFRLSEVGHTG